ncbi:1-deoxy-D-xylulose-5-phosphate reductoisomerase [Candidatus Thioglobus sp.]|jgi:1-deoxy-D-xylulose-5-phosphate reductoisomerase|uniref:1-deoxy-D-xylulose-5-phosphate reductoisomerase n=1 Tax=Candidatus Thioglobus sp. TaxID=2026721 RepID=UPI0001BD35AF|nr:1-deoxy-D-xylulose-5-phosphate reductoisomerase [Candidatus Thioglobus sp.]EEZ80445.1 MAG: 1-deoxy-D-xylulose 5-phosphate reductoisomerase [uncultured Candidatus Thioglobus sp.]MBT3186551.1 1-deoxy-D-xylulose-5-phosphate reductoisomerase [Candidatus Thioglobus sp.]MBT3432086.1 1-deoxy-D-xylulose-5-phosphate reductoisomerase [Candidatus Thioglobus sp.]MBT3965575.1 1-deoxy-D-xylulose-5-phosphate reductoisomerase [Candidatus Thioglobus sp.]MBT4315936.1 1-deoxy-D-xylulose-5-phosphate reductoiso
MKNITLLGATGSIGKSTLSVIDLHRDQFNVFALSANTNWQQMVKLCNKYQPNFAVMRDEASALELQNALDNDTQVLSGVEALCKIAAHEQTDYVMAAIVGAAGMASSLAAAKAGKRIMLANKESLVLAGDIFIEAVKNSGAKLIPVDSEHSAIFQCLQSGKSGLSKIQLTASGGPFLHTPISGLQSITPDEACAHPNWSMGRKISVDSATMMNKGLEVIEAYYLFALKPEQIDVVIHPQSIVHSSVYYDDGSTLSQLGNPDMRSVISYAMAYPNRISAGVAPLDLANNPPLEFYTPDLDKFACLGLAFDALKQGGSAMGTINAANEIAVDAFLNHQIKFLDIPTIIEKTLSQTQHTTLCDLDAIIANDQSAREIATQIVKQHA